MADIRVRKGLVILFFASVFLLLSLSLFAKADFKEYEAYVHTYVDSLPLGNWTYMEKPVFPVLFNDSQIQIGQNWSVVCPLRANHSYHIYCYGDWINNGSTPKTDYDIYVYDPSGIMVGYHTESAGLPEHIGTTVDESFFVPQSSGNFTFTVNNDLRESNGSQRATFMIIEDVPCNFWNVHHAEGKGSDGLPVLKTSWAYEFVTESQYVEVWLKIPDGLDMYETRIYLMADEQSKNKTLLTGVPLAWEPGLYGERDGPCGGYNLESKGYRGVAYASCEYYGQDMFLNYTSPHAGKSLYHLVLIGEAGSGDVEFLIKTEFNNTSLKPSVVPGRVHPFEDATIEYVSSATDLHNATLQYSVNSWTSNVSIAMDLSSNRTCRAVIPGQIVGTIVNYRVEASDVLQNALVANGSYSVKHELAMNVSLVHESVTLGDNVTVTGTLTPLNERLPVIVYVTSENGTDQITCYTDENGAFTASFKPPDPRSYSVLAKFEGDSYYYECASDSLVARVNEPSILAKYALYIGGGVTVAAIAGAVVYWKKFKE